MKVRLLLREKVTYLLFVLELFRVAWNTLAKAILESGGSQASLVANVLNVLRTQSQHLPNILKSVDCLVSDVLQRALSRWDAAITTGNDETRPDLQDSSALLVKMMDAFGPRTFDDAVFAKVRHNIQATKSLLTSLVISLSTNWSCRSPTICYFDPP
jgi:hypothetical protein